MPRKTPLIITLSFAGLLAPAVVPTAGAAEVCETFTMEDDLRLPPGSPQLRTSLLPIATPGTILDLDVVGLNGNHAQFSELTFALVSPSATTVDLLGTCATGAASFDLSLDDEAAASLTCPPPNDGGTYQPSSALSAFDAENMQGTWALQVNDTSHSLGGWVRGWGLHICYEALDADLGITKTIDDEVLVPGETVTYTIVVTNHGPDAVVGATVADVPPAELSDVTWTCTGSGGASCAADGNDQIDESVDLPNGATATFELSGTLAADFEGELTNTATVAPPAGVIDDNPANDEATAVGATPIGPTDEIPPTALAVRTVGRDRQGMGAITQFFVQWDEPMNAAAAASENYLVVAPGSNGILETAGCGTLGGDDLAVSIDDVFYDVTTDTSYLQINAGTPLPAGRYLFAACADAIGDLADNPLDGDGDGIGGDDLLYTHRVAVEHREVNPNFDSDLAGWTLSSPAAGGASWDEADVTEVPTSGSLLLAGDDQAENGPWAASQCVAAEPEHFGYQLAAAVHALGDVEATVSAVLYTSGDCTGAPVTLMEVTSIGDTEGDWRQLTVDYRNPPTADVGSAMVEVSVVPGAEAPVDWEVRWDEVNFVPTSIFYDGFETGDTTRWSNSVGVSE